MSNDHSTRRTALTPTPVISRAILGYNRGRERAPGGRHRHHAVAQSSADRRLQIQSAERRSRRYRCDQMDPGSGQRTAARDGMPASNACRSPRRSGVDDAPGRFMHPYVRDLAECRRYGCDPAPASNSASIPGRRRRAYWEPINDRLQTEHHGGQHDRRPDVFVHDRRSRRRDPHGLSRVRMRWRGWSD